MSASTGPREAYKKGPITDLVLYYMASGVTVNKGTLVSAREATDGYAYPARSGTSTDIFLGVAYETTARGNDRRAWSFGYGTGVRVEKSGSFIFATTGMAQTNIGAAVYATDDETVTLTSTNNQLVGYITEVISATSVRVRIDRAVQ